MKPNKQMIADEILFHLEAGKGFEETFELILTKRNLSRPTFATYWKVANESFLKTLEGRKQLFEDNPINNFRTKYYKSVNVKNTLFDVSGTLVLNEQQKEFISRKLKKNYKNKKS